MQEKLYSVQCFLLQKAQSGCENDFSPIFISKATRNCNYVANNETERYSQSALKKSPKTERKNFKCKSHAKVLFDYPLM